MCVHACVCTSLQTQLSAVVPKFIHWTQELYHCGQDEIVIYIEMACIFPAGIETDALISLFALL